MTDRCLTACIVDDEAPARALLREYLGDHPEFSVVAECANGFDAVKVLTETPVDLLLLDIQMPKLNGFEVLELITPPQAVIFTTAYDEHAVHAFEVHAVDYLLKPFSRERFAAALERARARVAPPAADLARTAHPPGTPLERIVVRTAGAVHVIAAHTIDYIEAQDDEVRIQCGGAAHRKQMTLAALAERLDPARFVRVHRSFLLNIERLDRVELYAKDSRVAILKDGTRLPVSRSGYAALRLLL
jgi:two-component system LytT family response regulator